MAKIDPATLKPMESVTTDALPDGDGWQFEPKYDGFRCLAYRRGETVDLRSRNQRPLGRYFPELAEAISRLEAARFLLDGEIVIPGGSFELLQLRLHPAASRVAKLAAADPARLIVFDLLEEGRHGLLDRPLAERRVALEAFVARHEGAPGIALSRATRSAAEARRWLSGMQGLDGIMAKRLDLPYRPGERAMLKFKQWKSFDCVLGGLYRKAGTGEIETLLFGLYDESGRLDYVGRVPVHGERDEIARKVQPLVGGSGFTGRSPGGPSRWSRKERRLVPLRPDLVAELSADHVTGGQMRHGARLLRWRDDKQPRQCTWDQLRAAESSPPVA